MNQPRLPITIIVLLASMSLLAGCFSLGGGTRHHHHQNYDTTLGQELMDLEIAKEEGVISEGEYKVLRKKILAR